MPRKKEEKRKISVKGPKLYPHQQAVVNKYLKFRKGTVISVLSARQRGKSYLLKTLVLFSTINASNFKVIVITPTFALADKTFRELSKIYKQIPKLVKSCNGTTFTIELVNGSSVMMKSVEQRDALRGFTANLLLIDEASFCNKEVVEQCCWPYVNTTNGTIILFSTPRFKTDEDLFYHYWSLAQPRDTAHFQFVDWRRYDTSMLLSDERKEMLRKTLPSKIYLNEIEGEFLDLEGSVFGDFSKVLRNNYDLNDTHFWMGIDTGRGTGDDYTSITVFNSQRQMVRIRYFNDKNATDTIKEIVKLVNEYKPKVVSCEINSLGQVYYDLLKSELAKNPARPTLHKFTTTNETKRDVVEALALAIESRDIQLLDDQELVKEMTVFECQKTQAGKSITYNAPSGYHDDLILSTALALNAMKVANYKFR